MENTYSILIVEDEEDICEILQFNLQSEGYKVDVVLSAEDALKKDLSKYDIFLLDVMMTGMSGFKLAEELRKKQKISVPILFLTAKNTENDKLTGFSLGADDYITKPFSVREVLARVKAVLKRAQTVVQTNENSIKIEGLELETEKKRLLVDGERVDLTPREYKIIYLLLKNKGKVFSREEILSYAWQNDGYVIDRTIDVHITRIRKKLGIYHKMLVSRSGYGYCFETN